MWRYCALYLFHSGHVAIQFHLYPEKHQKLLLPESDSNFPNCVSLAWKKDLPEMARQSAALALVKMIVARPYHEWLKGSLNTNVATLSFIWQTDDSAMIKNSVGLCLERILRVYPPGSSLHLSSGTLSLDVLRDEVSRLTQVETTINSLFNEPLQQLDEWSKAGCDHGEMPPDE